MSDDEIDLPEEEEEEEDFAAMFEESLEPTSFKEGELIEGFVVAIGKEVAFVDVGGKGEATIELEELRGPEGELDVQSGDIVQGVVVSTRGGLKLSHRLARGAASRQQLGEAYRAGLPVEGRVEKSIKGGFDVRVAGLRAFCPVSQIDTRYTEEPTIHEGQVYTFRITEYTEDGNNLVVSRRALLEEEERERAEEVRLTLVPGADVEGQVVGVRPYGAFVDLGGGIQGLLHVSEMSYSRVADPATVVQPGDQITVKVLRIDEDKGKISLGLKQLLADPWSTAEDTYEVGQMLMGTVTRIAEFGVFIEMEPGIEALAHASTFAPTGRPDAWKESVVVGTAVAVEVLSFDPERKRIGVAINAERSAKAGDAQRLEVAPGARLTGKVERHEPYGVFVFLAPGRTGLMPLEETGVERGVDLRKKFPVGSDVEVVVLEIDETGKRIRLSRKALFEAEEQREVRRYADRQDTTPTDGLGSLAEKLRAAMKRQDD